jgi:hypothetical protein
MEDQLARSEGARIAARLEITFACPCNLIGDRRIKAVLEAAITASVGMLEGVGAADGLAAALQHGEQEHGRSAATARVGTWR